MDIRCTVPTRWHYGLSALGAVLCAVAVGLAAYTAHAAPEIGKPRLEQACLMLFFHAFAVSVFAVQQRGKLATISVLLWLAGCFAFSGSLVAAVFFDTSTRFAPWGGLCFMLGWLIRAGLFLRPVLRKNAALQ